MKGPAIRAAGRLLFGLPWRTPFMVKFEIGDATLRRMIKDERPVPEGLARDIEMALREKANAIDELLEAMVVKQVKSLPLHAEYDDENHWAVQSSCDCGRVHWPFPKNPPS